MKNTFLISLILIGLIFLSGCDEEKTSCKDSGGKWVGFSNNCVDSCDYIRGNVQTCGQILTQGCDCGPNKCWNGKSCEAN